jgi:hypothetical protein
MSEVEHGSVIMVDVPIAGHRVQMPFKFYDLSRMPNGDGWEASTQIPVPNGRRFRASDVTADRANKRLIAEVATSQEARDWVMGEFADGDELHRDPPIPPE